MVLMSFSIFAIFGNFRVKFEENLAIFGNFRVNFEENLVIFGNFRVKFEENLAIFCFLYKKFLRFCPSQGQNRTRTKPQYTWFYSY